MIHLLLCNAKSNFYPRSPCGERPNSQQEKNNGHEFLSTLSLRRATSVRPETRQHDAISIHALLAESDNRNLASHCRNNNFYPRSPCGERLVHALKLANTMLFLSTLSLRRATADTTGTETAHENFYPRSPCGERRRKGSRRCVLSSISIHALLAESDKIPQQIASTPTYFYPRSPCGERHRQRNRHPYPLDFYPRSPCGERPCQ